MGQLLSWIRGPRDDPALRDVAVEQQSEPSQTTPTPGAQVTTVKPAQFETPSQVSQVKASAAATPSPPAGGTRATSAAGTAASAAQARPTPKDTMSAAAAATQPVRDTPKADPAKPAMAVAPAAVAAAVGVSGKGKTEVAKPAETKVQVEVAPPAAKAAKEVKAWRGVVWCCCSDVMHVQEPALDPFDALANILPAVGPLVPPEPVYTGPEVHEPETGVLCGVRDDTLPPNYRYENLPPAPVDVKPKDVPKPMSTDEALDSLSFGFCTAPTAATAATPVQQEKMDSTDAIDALSAGFSNFAAPPTASVKVFTSTSQTPAALTVCECPACTKIIAPCKQNLANRKDLDDAMSLDALAALGDTLGAPEPVPESPKLRPEDIVSEEKVDEEKGVLVGEREDTLPPDYRFPEDKLKDLPAPKPEPTLAPGEALDFLSDGFMTCPTAAPVVQTSCCVAPSAPPAQAEVESLSALDALAGDFMTPTQASAVQAPLPSPAKKTPKDDSMSLDALAALGDTLAAPEPAPEPPKLRPEDIVSEGKVASEKGVLVGEREDTLPPDYRFPEDKLKDLPAPKPEPTLAPGEALDFLSDGFMTCPTAAPVVQTSCCVAPSAPPAQPTLNTGEALDMLSDDFMTPALAPAVQAPVCCPAPPPASADAAALDALAGDFIATAVVAPAVECAANQPTQTSRQMSSSALDALSDSLMDIQPVPEPAPLPMKDIAKEKKVVEERLIKMGEDDDTLPPEYRPTEEDIKTPMGDAAALDLLSSEFAVTPCPAAHSAADSKAGTQLPDAQETKPKGEKAKVRKKQYDFRKMTMWRPIRTTCIHRFPR
ncbi:Calpastatin [Merluccius polli]|uniref:Calpastatin n=1 Tax=Merluccius polli TaxID=89951 RepID=A0AA47NW54_MERPO|nr:Calpastatin [Merluccius polli]